MIEDFRTSYPWFFMFKALVEGHEPSAVPRSSTTSTPSNTASTSKQSQANLTKRVVQAGPSTTVALPDISTSNPFSNLRPTSSRPKPNRTASSSISSAPRPTVHTTHGAGSSSQIPIDIDLDSVASDKHQDDAKRANEVIDLTSPKPKKSSKNKSYVSSMLVEPCSLFQETVQISQRSPDRRRQSELEKAGKPIACCNP